MSSLRVLLRFVGTLLGKLLDLLVHFGPARPQQGRSEQVGPGLPPPKSRRPPSRPSSRQRASTRAEQSRGAALETSYDPFRDGQADPGEVVWTWVAYEDNARQGKDRPVLVIGHFRGRKVGVALTTKPHPRSQIEVGTGPWDQSLRVSYAKLDRLIDLEMHPIRREGAVLDRKRFNRVVRAVEARWSARE